MAASEKLHEVKEGIKTDIATLEDVEFGDSKPNDHEEFVENTPEEKALRRKIDWYLMPSVWILYLYVASPSPKSTCIFLLD